MNRPATLPSLDWNDLRYVLAIAEHETITAAAGALGVSQPTASRRLAALETSLGVKLFLRGASGYIPTAAGRRLMELAAPLAAQLARVESGTLDDHDRVAGTVRVATTEVTALHLIEGALPNLLREHPELSIDFLVGNLAADLSRGEADLAVRLMTPESPELLRSRLGTMRYGLYASPSYLASAPDPAAAGLVGHRVVLPVRSMARGPEASWLATHATGAKASVHVDHPLAVVGAAEAGVGLAVLPDVIGAAHRGLSRVRSLDDLAPRAVWLVYHRDLRGVARVRAVAGAVKAHLTARLDAAGRVLR